MNLNKGTRVRFKTEWRGKFGQKASIGQCGTIKLSSGLSQYVVVELDGWKQDKEKERLLAMTTGESTNVVPWIVRVPIYVLES